MAAYKHCFDAGDDYRLPAWLVLERVDLGWSVIAEARSEGEVVDKLVKAIEADPEGFWLDESLAE